MIHECRTEADIDRLLQESHRHPALLLKHSTRCPLSSMAYREFQEFCRTANGVSCWLISVTEYRPVSAYVARQSSIRHQSPQAILFRNGEAVWDASHGAITSRRLADACAVHNS